MDIRTHQALNARLCGEVVSIAPGEATVMFTASSDMLADSRGLVHGGFVFGLADHAAMLAVNDPNVVLGDANVRFLAPVSLNQVVRAMARVVVVRGKKREIEVVARVAEVEVLRGTLTAFVLDKHVLDGRSS